jgi:predicted XRE-type DNA-binding protein
LLIIVQRPDICEMTSVLTGDIVQSRKLANQATWLVPLKKTFNTIGRTPKTWEIYRGDSFQIEIKQPENALYVAIRIKAVIKCIKNIDVRMGIGIGRKDFDAKKVTECNGEAFVYSGEQFEGLKKEKQLLALRSPWKQFDQEMNLYIRLAMIAMDNWSPAMAEIIKISLENPKMNQLEIGELLGISQSSVSERQKRAFFTEIMEVEAMYREKLGNAHR